MCFGVCLYLDVEIDQLKPGTGNISADQLSLVARDAEQWHARFPDWYEKVAGVPWSKKELSIAHKLIVTWIREFMNAEGEGHSRVCLGKVVTGGRKSLPTGEDLELIVSQAHRGTCCCATAQKFITMTTFAQLAILLLFNTLIFREAG